MAPGPVRDAAPGDRDAGAAAAARDRCPRCGAAFACGAAGAAPCACTTVALTAELSAALRQRYDGCLCLACLRQLAAGGDDDAVRPSRIAPANRP